jgi:hypothetical protein
MIAACVKNSEGSLLAYTVQSTKSQVEEYCIEVLWGQKIFDNILAMGAEIVQIEIKEI